MVWFSCQYLSDGKFRYGSPIWIERVDHEVRHRRQCRSPASLAAPRRFRIFSRLQVLDPGGRFVSLRLFRWFGFHDFVGDGFVRFNWQIVLVLTSQRCASISLSCGVAGIDGDTGDPSGYSRAPTGIFARLDVPQLDLRFLRLFGWFLFHGKPVYQDWRQTGPE